MWTWSEQLICGRDNECVIGNVPNGDTNTMAVRGRERDPLPPSTIIKCDHRVVFTYSWPSVVAIATDTLHTYHYHQPVCSCILLSLTTLHRNHQTWWVCYQPLVYWAPTSWAMPRRRLWPHNEKEVCLVTRWFFSDTVNWLPDTPDT